MWGLGRRRNGFEEFWKAFQDIVLGQGLKRINGNLPARKTGKAIPIRGNSVCKRTGAWGALAYPRITRKFGTVRVEDVRIEWWEMSLERKGSEAVVCWKLALQNKTKQRKEKKTNKQEKQREGDLICRVCLFLWCKYSHLFSSYQWFNNWLTQFLNINNMVLVKWYQRVLPHDWQEPDPLMLRDRSNFLLFPENGSASRHEVCFYGCGVGWANAQGAWKLIGADSQAPIAHQYCP